MDTYSIYKAAKGVIKRLLKEKNPDQTEEWCECEADILANEVVEDCIAHGTYYPYSEINKRPDPPIFPTGQLFR